MSERITFSVDPDVAVLVRRLRIGQKKSLKQVINDGLRKGLPELEKPAAVKKPFRTKTADLGKCLLPSLDRLTEVLDQIEGPNWR
jgi:hypothetical protein